VLFIDVISIATEVVEVFHLDAVLLLDRLSKIAVRLERSRDPKEAGGGRTGPVGGHLAIT
jgi:hypothetical protein